MTRRVLLIPGILAALVWTCLPASGYSEAGMIRIVDASNDIRAEGSVDESGSVEFSLLDQNGTPAEGIQVSLVNQDTKQSMVQTTVGGKALFEDVTPGTWQVSVAEDWARFAVLIKITGTAATGLDYGSAAAAGAAALGIAGGTVAIANSSGDDKPLSPAS